ncbi:MFS transporter [Rhizobium gallicum]|uniref:MFS transporter n=1 Tax=Rhizobium gallicum TaxID=56730 RepID=UPI001EF99368|nr:MFS transporter [Rhizobium gallicum]ULJ75778.1 MFS transporter [Rhizobium gallicum]
MKMLSPSRHLYEPYLIKGLLLVRAKLGRKSSSLLSNSATSIGSRPTADRAKERRRHFFEDDEPFNYADHERPLVPGSPGTPLHPPLRRLIYALTSLVAGMTGALGNGLVSANLPYLQGALGLNVSEIAWLPAVYLITNAVTGCILVKYRQQFGIRSFCLIFLGLQTLLIGAHLLVGNLASAILLRGASGVCGSAMGTLGVLYMVQAMSAKRRLAAVTLGLGIPQLALPIAWVIPKDFLAFGSWSGLYLFEFGLSLVSLGVVMVVRLPPTVRSPAFEPLDAVSFGLYASGIGLFGAAMGLGSYLWWTNAAWIGWCLAGSLPCLALFALIEFHRQRPLVDVRWLSAGTFVRWAVIAVICRVAQSEQAAGVISMLRDFGLTNDDFRTLTFVILAGAAAGLFLSAFFISPSRLAILVLVSLAFASTAAYLDSFSSLSTRAPQLVWSQAMMGAATTMFFGPVFIFGLGRVLMRHGVGLTSFVAIFGITQSVGALVCNSLLQTYLFHAQQYHLTNFAVQTEKSDPAVMAATSVLSSQYLAVLTDPALRGAQGVQALSQQVILNARVAAYNDVYLAISLAAAFGLLLLLGVVLITAFRQPRKSTP